MQKKIGIAIMAAGEGRRFKIDCPKPLASIAGHTMIDQIIETIFDFEKATKTVCEIGIITGHRRAEVEAHIMSQDTPRRPSFAFQERQLGTGDAVKSYFSKIESAAATDYTIVLCADTPLLTAYDLSKLYDAIKLDGELGAVVATFISETPKGYGRILRGKSGLRIVEEKECSESERNIKEVNSGLYIFKTKFLIDGIKKLKDNNRANEFYLTDLFTESAHVSALLFENSENFLGVNDITQLEIAEKILMKRIISDLRSNGVRFIDSDRVVISRKTEIGSGTIVYPNVVFEGENKIDENVIIESNSIIRNSSIGIGAKILANSYIEKSIIREGANVGPFARVRPESDVGTGSKVGNFVELKKAKLGVAVKVSHLSYVGDAEIGDETNIGCGFITCNYDGVKKHRTTIGKRTFIGSDCQAIAPVNIGSESFVAAGTTITDDVADGDFAIGRSRQVNKEGRGRIFLKKE